MAFNDLASSASVFTPLLPGDCLTTNYISDLSLLKHLGTDSTENTASSSSSVVASHRCRTVSVENAAAQFTLFVCVSSCCGHYLAMAVVYRVITYS
jgi:hypothetical protein